MKHNYLYGIIDTVTGEEWDGLRSKGAAEILGGGIKHAGECFDGPGDMETSMYEGRLLIYRYNRDGSAATKIAALKTANGMEWFNNFCEEWNQVRRMFGVMT